MVYVSIRFKHNETIADTFFHVSTRYQEWTHEKSTHIFAWNNLEVENYKNQEAYTEPFSKMFGEGR